ncbi:hypothetical protein LTR10_008324 [Elasticomyces elasticus]|nr:hypothetical protein LTR10_008324 [Elasticomyces elasticus]KAK4967199.1 hypothetical protein LTR42_010548 [Elasticomyces elasticus]
MASYNDGFTSASRATDGNTDNEDEVVQRMYGAFRAAGFPTPTTVAHTTQQTPPLSMSASMSHNATNGTAAYSGTGDNFPGANLPEYASGPAAAAYDPYNNHISQGGPYYMPPQNQQQSAGAERPTYPLSQMMDESGHQYNTHQPTPATSLYPPTARPAPTQTFAYQPINPGMNTQTQPPHTAVAPIFPRQALEAPKKKKKSYKSRVGTPRTRCNCPYAFCNCRETFYERTRGDNLQCAECLKAHPVRKIHTSSSATSHQSSQVGGQALFAQQPQAPAEYGDIFAQQAGAEYATPSIGRNDYSSTSSTPAMLPAHDTHTAQMDSVPAAILAQPQGHTTYNFTAGPADFLDNPYLQDDSISSPSANEAAHPNPLSFDGADLDFDPWLLDEMLASTDGTSPADGHAGDIGESAVSAEHSRSANDDNENNGVEAGGVAAESTEATQSPEFLDEFNNEADATARIEPRDGKVKLVKLNVEGTDDFDTVTDEVERQLKKSLFDAILHYDKSFTPEAVGLDKQAAYHTTQEDAHKQCKGLMRTSEDVGQASAACAKVYYTAKRLHETGVPCTLLQENGKRTKTNYYVDHSATFVLPIKTIIGVVAENKRIAVDLRHADREFTGLYDLILCPDAYLRRKLQNLAGNKVKNDILAQETARKKEEAKAANGDGKKVGRKSWMKDGKKQVEDGEVEVASAMGTEGSQIATSHQEEAQVVKGQAKRPRTVWDEASELEFVAMAPGTGRKRRRVTQKE